MWDGAFIGTSQVVTRALLRRAILPAGGRAFERVCGAIAVRAAFEAHVLDKTIAFLVPEATGSTALQISAALLVGNHAHSKGGGELPALEARPLFKGDLLVVTSSVSRAKAELEDLAIGSYQRVRDIWDVVPLSRYTAGRAQKPRVFLANPGWAMSMLGVRRFGAIVVDAAHPRTFRRLPELLTAVTRCSAVRVVVAPPLSAPVLAACGYPTKVAVWLWDRETQVTAEGVVGSSALPPRHGAVKTLWVCDSDREVAEKLERLYRHLLDVLSQAGRHPYPGLNVVWSVFARLRNLAVPLAQLEQAASGRWIGTLRQRIDSLSSIHGHGDPVWDATWPGLCTEVKETYALFLQRHETAKFWALAVRLEKLLKDGAAIFRIVVGSQVDADLLRRLLVGLIDGLQHHIADGSVDIVTPSHEARLVADGHSCHTLLLGPRSSASRHLDVFPSESIEEFVYPFETGIEQAAHQRMLAQAAELGAIESRIDLLAKLGLHLPRPYAEFPRPAWPRLNVFSAESGRAVEMVRSSNASALLDVSSLLPELEVEDDLDLFANVGDDVTPVDDAGDVVEVTYKQGAILRYRAKHSVDVFFSATSTIERKPVAELKQNWHVISFVDGQYDGLFRRLTEVVEGRLPTKERVALELWTAAKADLTEKFPDKREFHERLLAQGLTATYDALRTWFREGDESTLAPQQFDDFAVLAKASGVYPSDQLVEQTFRSIQKARGRNRKSGRLLRGFLRAVVVGEGYEDALESARSLDAGLGDVLAAVQVLDVANVRTLARRSS